MEKMSKAVNFQPDKPFRLSLYIDPKDKPASPVKISALNRSFDDSENNNKENQGSRKNVKKKNENKSKPSRGRLKEINTVLFEDDNDLLKPKRTRSTTKKSEKPIENKENVTKDEAPNEEDEEYQKWLQNITSEFEDIDKFELSVSYDD